MARYSTEFKLKCIKTYQNKEPLPKVDGVLEKSLRTSVQDWVLLYREYGIKGIETCVFYKNYTLQDKIKAVKLVTRGKSYSEVARLMGCRQGHATIRRWYLAYMNDGIAGLQYRKGIKPSTSVEISAPMKKRLSKSEREELLALRKRNEILELENEYLKKLDALVSKREKEEARAKKQK